MPAAEVPGDLLRCALEEYIALGPNTVHSPEDRLARRIPRYSAEARSAALVVAGEAAAAASGLAREHEAGVRTYESVVQTWEQRFPWVVDPAPPEPRPWWLRLLTRGTTRKELDLATRLANFGFYLIK